MKVEKLRLFPLLWIAVLLGLSVSCATQANFKIPKGTSLEIYDRPEVYKESGVIKTSPYFWTAAGGIKYKLLRDNKVVEEGKLPAKFRVVSIFWPPLALIYWPIGFRYDEYDLTKKHTKQ